MKSRLILKVFTCTIAGLFLPPEDGGVLHGWAYQDIPEWINHQIISEILFHKTGRLSTIKKMKSLQILILMPQSISTSPRPGSGNHLKA